jgi:nucleotide-binding universal stress UspA family protein
MKILVPTDFNNASFTAYQYASMLAEKLGASITLLHVIAGSFNTGDTLSFEPLQTMESQAYARLKFFATTYAEERNIELPKVAAHHVVRWGIPGFSIVDYADDKDYDLIVMGSRDKYGFLDRLLGSSSALAIRRADCPVLVIHADTPVRLPQQAVFAFDDKGDLEDALEAYCKINKHIGAHTKFVHIDNHSGQDNINEQVGDILAELIIDEEVAFGFEIEQKEGSDVAKQIKDYCQIEKADMLVIHRKEDGIFKNLFGSTLSVSIAQGVKLPVLIA